MRQLTRDYRISVPSIVEVHRGLGHEAERAHDELGMTVQGARRAVEPKGAHIVNWLACHLLTLPVEERNKILRRGKAIMDRHLESDSPVRFAEAEGSAVDAAGGKAPSVKGHPGRRHPGKDRGEGVDFVPVAADRPDRRS
jgi:hypothetical protein